MSSVKQVQGISKFRPGYILVLVPLCGKTKDLLWLADQGCQLWDANFALQWVLQIREPLIFENLSNVGISGSFLILIFESCVRDFLPNLAKKVAILLFLLLELNLNYSL